MLRLGADPASSDMTSDVGRRSARGAGEAAARTFGKSDEPRQPAVDSLLAQGV